MLRGFDGAQVTRKVADSTEAGTFPFKFGKDLAAVEMILV